jgi:hypothetical protein
MVRWIEFESTSPKNVQVRVDGKWVGEIRASSHVSTGIHGQTIVTWECQIDKQVFKANRLCLVKQEIRDALPERLEITLAGIQAMDEYRRHLEGRKPT